MEEEKDMVKTEAAAEEEEEGSWTPMGKHTSAPLNSAGNERQRPPPLAIKRRNKLLPKQERRCRALIINE
jgi:hypothetical protein